MGRSAPFRRRREVPATTPDPDSRRRRARVGPFEVDLRAGEVRRAGRRVRLAAKPFEVLAALVEAGGDVVLREELYRRLWPDKTWFDFDNNLNSAVATLRDALGDDADRPRFVETLPKRGYRLLAPVEWVAPPATAPAVPPATAGPRGPGGPDARSGAPSSRRPSLPWAAAALVAAALAGVAAVASLPLGRGGAGDPRDAIAAVDPAAREAFLRGRYLLQSRRPDGAQRARRELERAVSLEPSFAAAHAELAAAWAATPARPHETMPRARQAGERALALAPDLAEAHLRLGQIAVYYDYEWAAGERLLRRAAELDPGSSGIQQAVAAQHALCGRAGEAAEAMRRAMELDPVAATVAADAGWYQFVGRRYHAAFAQAERALELDPAHAGAHFYRFLALDRLGRLEPARDAALAHMRAAGAQAAPLAAVEGARGDAALAAYHRWNLERHLATAAGAYQSPAVAALDHLALGDEERALALLEEAYRERSGWLLPFAAVYPPLDPLRDDPRFVRLLERLRLPCAR